MTQDRPDNMRRFWLALWTLAVGLGLMLLFATLRERPFRPEALQYFPLDVLERGRQFSREVRLWSTLEMLLSLTLMAGLCFHPIGARILQWAEGLGRGRFWLGLISVAAVLFLITTAVELPFSYYLGYVHEKAYGLSRQTPSGWFLDYLKESAVNLVVTLILWLPIYWMIRRWPRRWWIPATLLNVVLSGCLVLLYPVVLLPLFNPLTPVKDPEILSMIQRLADRAGVAVETVEQMQVSDKSSRINAMVTGLGPTKRVILYDTLLQEFEPQEIEIVMAHELAHAVHRDVPVGWLLGSAGEALSLLLTAWMLGRMVGVPPLNLPAAHAGRGFALLLLLTSLLGPITSPVHNIVSRRAEVRADRFALQVTGNPQAFISGFKKLAAENPGDVDPPFLVEFMNYSHPSVTSRIHMAAREFLKQD